MAPLDTRAALDAGWQEAVISSSSPAPLLRFFTEVAGWHVRETRPLDSRVRRFYLPDDPDAGRPVHGAREWLVADRDGLPGFVRVIDFRSPTARPVRASAMAWDTGGILSLMTRSNATDRVYRNALALGWTALNDPVVLNLPDTGVSLTNVVLRGPEGVHVAVYERLTPRTPDAPDLQRLRRPFNSMQSVRDLAAARRFYVDVLGFEVVNSGNFVNPVRAPNNFGVPANLVPDNPLPFVIVGPKRNGPTQVELLQFAGVEGRSVAAIAAPPNLGVVALRFPVTSLATVELRLRAAQWPLTREPAELPLGGLGRVRLLAVRSPEGAWLEFFEKLDP